MSATCQTAPEMVAPLAFRPPPGLAASLAALGPVATARLRLRQLLSVIAGTHRRRPGGGDPNGPPEDRRAEDNYWDDPALWMLMLH